VKEICVISLSRKDDEFKDKKMEEVINWLRAKKRSKKPRYNFAKLSPKNGLPPGSIVLFSFEAQIFGHATVEEDLEGVPFDQQEVQRKAKKTVYRHFIILDYSSIDVFKKYPKKKDLSKRWNRRFGRLFTYITQRQYQDILRIAGE